MTETINERMNHSCSSDGSVSIFFFFFSTIILLRLSFGKSSPFNARIAVHPSTYFQRVTLVSPSPIDKRASPPRPPGPRLYSLDLVGHHHRVLLADLGGGVRFVVVGTVVLV